MKKENGKYYAVVNITTTTEKLEKTGKNTGIDLGTFNFIEILFLFAMAYIFEYGYEIQLDSKGKMYGEVNE